MELPTIVDSYGAPHNSRQLLLIELVLFLTNQLDQMSKMRKQFTKEERLEIVKQSFEPDVHVADVAAKFGIGANTLSRWRREFRQANGIVPSGQGIKVMTDEEREIARLKKQLREAQLERDILKKAISIFSKGDGKYTNS